MADIELVIKIPKELFSEIDDENYQSKISWYDATLFCAIKNGTLLPKGHGDLIDRKELLKQPMDLANFPSNYVMIASAIIEADKTESEDKG